MTHFKNNTKAETNLTDIYILAGHKLEIIFERAGIKTDNNSMLIVKAGSRSKLAIEIKKAIKKQLKEGTK